MSSQDELIAQRRANLDALAALGVEIYPHRFDRRHTVSELVEAHGEKDHDTLEAECAGVVFAGPSGRAVRPKVAYSITDDWKVLAGVEILQGETSSLFGLLHRNSTAYLELRLGF